MILESLLCCVCFNPELLYGVDARIAKAINNKRAHKEPHIQYHVKSLRVI